MFHSKFDLNTYFMADMHLSHKNLCKGTSEWKSGNTRDFPDLDSMNNAIIDSVNANVKESDHLFLLGDSLFGKKNRFHEFFNRINCKNLYYVFGNHSDYIRNDQEKLSRFKWSGDYLEISIHGQFIVLFHYPISEWRDCNKSSWCLCGHSHGNNHESNYKTSKYKCLDVGWDVFNRPVSFSEIRTIMNKKENKGHH